jgi:hypothetical protein
MKTRQKDECLLLTPIEPGVRLSDVGMSHFTRSETIACGSVSFECLLFELLTYC